MGGLACRVVEDMETFPALSLGQCGSLLVALSLELRLKCDPLWFSDIGPTANGKGNEKGHF